jgi:hypothetical protein
MMIHIVLSVVKLLTIVSEKTLDYKKHMSLQIGHIYWTKVAISSGPSRNLQGDFKFMALNTGKKIVHRSWDVTPMPDLIINRCNALGSDRNQQITFTDRHDRLIGYIEIPGVDANEDKDFPLPGVVPLIAYQDPRSECGRTQGSICSSGSTSYD